MFVWQDITGATRRYHDEGGLVVLADSIDRAKEIILEKAETEGTYLVPKRDCEALSRDPDYVREIGAGSEEIFVFPDAGCCE